jgi:hypothetical protein
MESTAQSNPHAPNAAYWKRRVTLRRLLVIPILAWFSLIIGLALGYGAGQQPLIMMLLGLVAAPLVWRKPILGAYALIFSAAAVETFNMEFPDSFTDRFPLYKPFDQMGLPIPITATELMMLGMIVLVSLKRIGERKVPLELGPLFPALAIYLVFVIFGVANGIGNGGEFNIAIWEMRAQFYPLFMYLIVYNLVSEHAHARKIMWLYIGVVAFKGLLGVFRLVFVLKGNLEAVTVVSRNNSLMSHEESLLFAAFLTFGALLFLFKADRRQLKFIMYTSFPVALSFLANQRRAGIMALILSLMVVGLVVYIQQPKLRRPLIYAVIAFMVVMAPYTVAFRNSSGLIAQPARSVLSIVRPDARDAGSNDYRVLEGENVGRNIALHPIIGAGYGREMELFVDLPNLTNIFSLWAFIPHNTILWVWMRLGILGFAAFWFMVGRMLMDTSLSARRVRDPYLKAIAILTITMIMAWITQGLVDMGLTDFRLNMLLGAFIGLSARLPQLDREKKYEEPAPEPVVAAPAQPALRMRA